MRVNAVRFTPGARTAWHSHALGQRCMSPKEPGVSSREAPGSSRIRAGDIVFAPADEEHWHGADPDHYMTHLSITEAPSDSQKAEADWGAHVTDAEYEAGER